MPTPVYNDEDKSLLLASDSDTHALHVDTVEPGQGEESDSANDSNISVHELEIDDDWSDSGNAPMRINYCFTDPYTLWYPLGKTQIRIKKQHLIKRRLNEDRPLKLS